MFEFQAIYAGSKKPIDFDGGRSMAFDDLNRPLEYSDRESNPQAGYHPPEGRGLFLRIPGCQEQQALRRENAQLTDRLRILGQKLERLPALEGCGPSLSHLFTPQGLRSAALRCETPLKHDRVF